MKPVRDPALQPERTRLAWRRTTLTVTVVAVLAVRQAAHQGLTPPRVLGVALGALLWLAFLLVAHRRIEGLDSPRPGALTPRAALAAAVCTVAFAALAAAVL
ncbi:DUF202 domain-containing protein [Streptomyces sp. GC420]|uniref:DUF202 domain-containing protein n=1 Tax=Streptomyces sp. GC420 TaxID=2697568 RepID=UPI0014150943|nr:DUF202 domain-containing protein [Streptomyces sp. GC420]NBM16225.1 DUF202 domain-containing protein [Streptomyces sp. GC420]